MAGEAPTIRRATALDAVAIVKLLLRVSTEHPAGTSVDHQKAVEHILQMLRVGLILVAEKGNRIVGVLATWYHSEDWGSTKHLDVQHFYVLPAHRKHDTARRLLSALEAIQDEIGCAMFISIAATAKPETKDRLMSTLGYRYIGGMFMRCPDGKQAKAHDGDDQSGPAAPS